MRAAICAALDFSDLNQIIADVRAATILSPTLKTELKETLLLLWGHAN